MKKILRESELRRMVRECIQNFINESFVINEDSLNAHGKKVQKKMLDYLDNKIKDKDENTLDVFKTMGYNLDKKHLKNMQNKIDQIYDGGHVSKEVSDDVLKAASILSKYTDKQGNCFIIRDEDVPKRDTRRYIEDDYSMDETMYLKRMRDFMDLNKLTYLYDKTEHAEMGVSHHYGMKDKDDDISNLDFNDITKDEIETYRRGKVMSKDDAARGIKGKIVQDYLSAKYGMVLKTASKDLKVDFTMGNTKLPKSTLIVNFESAVGCPAWNECIVKHACYARGTETNGQRRNVYDANKKRGLLWRATKNDPEFMNLLMQFVRSHCVNFINIANEVSKLGLITVENGEDMADKLCSTPFSDSLYTPEILDIVKKHKIIENIRLNENGDFVGQWLVDAWDKEAAEFNLIGINVSAYTCRHLNYEGIKNIILNTSFIPTNGNSNIARHFIAVPSHVYEQLDETYVGKNNQLTINKGKVLPNFQPLFNKKTKKPNGKVYYKCPCNRTVGNKEIDCYECQVCYNPKNNPEQTIVFIEVHGHMPQALLRKSLNDTGVSQSMLSLPEYNNVSKKLEVASVQKPNDKIINEEYNTPTNNTSMAERLGIKTITNNAIKSLYNKLG